MQKTIPTPTTRPARARGLHGSDVIDLESRLTPSTPKRPTVQWDHFSDRPDLRAADQVVTPRRATGILTHYMNPERARGILTDVAAIMQDPDRETLILAALPLSTYDRHDDPDNDVQYEDPRTGVRLEYNPRFFRHGMPLHLAYARHDLAAILQSVRKDDALHDGAKVYDPTADHLILQGGQIQIPDRLSRGQQRLDMRPYHRLRDAGAVDSTGTGAKNAYALAAATSSAVLFASSSRDSLLLFVGDKQAAASTYAFELPTSTPPDGGGDRTAQRGPRAVTPTNQVLELISYESTPRAYSDRVAA